MLSIYVTYENTKPLQKIERKNIEKCQSYVSLNYGRHLEHRRHLESDKKTFLL
jgi:hypothetical protein